MRVVIAGSRAFGAAVANLCISRGDDIAAVWSPAWASDGVRRDRLRVVAEDNGIPWSEAGTLRAENMPNGVDVLISAHSHDFIGRLTRAKCRIGAVGYHPSLLPLHRGRDAVRWTIRMGDRIAGGSAYWLTDNIDAGDIAAQEWCFVRTEDTPEELWRRELFPIGVRLIAKVLSDADNGRVVAVPQDKSLATWEPSWEREPVRRPDLIMIGQAQGYEVRRTSE